jgi:hypothetical protein
MSINSPTNGQHKLLWWITGAVLGPVFLMVFGLVVNTTFGNSQRLSGLEAEGAETHRRLDRIERKLDQLLERR